VWRPSVDQLGERGEEAGERLARAGGGDEQGVAAGAGLAQHVELMAAGVPAAGGEPVGQRLGEVHHGVCRVASGRFHPFVTPDWFRGPLRGEGDG
jgi:hypothetical protein